MRATQTARPDLFCRHRILLDGRDVTAGCSAFDTERGTVSLSPPIDQPWRTAGGDLIWEEHRGHVEVVPMEAIYRAVYGQRMPGSWRTARLTKKRRKAWVFGRRLAPGGAQ